MALGWNGSQHKHLYGKLKGVVGKRPTTSVVLSRRVVKPSVIPQGVQATAAQMATARVGFNALTDHEKWQYIQFYYNIWYGAVFSFTDDHAAWLMYISVAIISLQAFNSLPAYTSFPTYNLSGGLVFTGASLGAATIALFCSNPTNTFYAFFIFAAPMCSPGISSTAVNYVLIGYVDIINTHTYNLFSMYQTRFPESCKPGATIYFQVYGGAKQMPVLTYQYGFTVTF